MRVAFLTAALAIFWTVPWAGTLYADPMVDMVAAQKANADTLAAKV